MSSIALFRSCPASEVRPAAAMSPAVRSRETGSTWSSWSAVAVSVAFSSLWPFPLSSRDEAGIIGGGSISGGGGGGGGVRISATVASARSQSSSIQMSPEASTSGNEMLWKSISLVVRLGCSMMLEFWVIEEPEAGWTIEWRPDRSGKAWFQGVFHDFRASMRSSWIRSHGKWPSSVGLRPKWPPEAVMR